MQACKIAPYSLLILASLASGFEPGPKTTAYWKFDSASVKENSFLCRNGDGVANDFLLPWMEAPVIKEFEGRQGVQVSRTAFGRLPYHVDLTSGNSEKVISYGARIKLDTMRKDYSSFVAGFYDSHRFMVDTMGRFHLGIQNEGRKRAQQWLRTDSEKGQPLVEVKRWYEVVFTIDARDPGRVLGYFFLDGKQQLNPHFAINDDGVRSTNINPFQVGKDPSDPGPPWYGSPLHGLIGELIIEKGYLIEPTFPHTGPLNNRVNLGTRSVSAKAGDSLWVPVLLTNYSDLTLGSCQFTLRMNALVTELLEVKKDGISLDWSLDWNMSGSGAYRIALGGQQTPMKYGEGVLLQLRIRVKPEAVEGGYSDLSLDDVKLDENRMLEFSTTTGRIRVEPTILLGDVTGDGMVDLSDALKVFEYVVGKVTLPDTSLPDFTLAIADVSGNGEITSYDGALILQHAAGLLPDFPARKPAKALAKRSVAGGLATKLVLSAPVAAGSGSYEYRLGGENLAALVAGEFVLALDPALATKVESATTPLRGARLSAVLAPGGKRLVLTLARNDRYQSFPDDFITLKIAQTSAVPALSLASAYLNEGRLTGDFLSAPAHGAPVGTAQRLSSGKAPFIHAVDGNLEIPSVMGGRVSVTLFTVDGKPLMEREFSGNGRILRVPLERIPRGLFGFEVRMEGRRYRGFSVRM